MATPVTAKLKRINRQTAMTGPLVTLSVGVIVPVFLSASAGILLLILGKSSVSLLFGILVVCFTSAAIGAAIIVVILLGRRARIARLQADLLANVSHELRTPLAAVRMYAESLLSGLLKDDPVRTEESLHLILQQTEWLDAMIDRVLTWRMAARDRDVLNMETASIRPALEEAVLRFTRMTPPAETELSVQIETTLPVRHDRRAIGEIALNLLVNAYKYTGPDKKVRIEARDEDGGVAIAVRDNGIGIPRSVQKKIFDPFYRVDTGLRSKAPGAGLGLAIVQHLVKIHGGKILVESEPGRGSLFTIHLPVAREESPPQ
ncbi:MAG: HAMP domain-containing sensor histidine kinase [Candidatus Aminicenantes bacterium]|nr:HAMP domain-containing sensor histidine kinase [Candidatus Aminicenantes bacterium]